MLLWFALVSATSLSAACARPLTDCGRTITSQGQMTVPGSTEPMLCIWEILPDETSKKAVYLDFRRFDGGRCALDPYGNPLSYVALWLGTSLVGPYCGTELPPITTFRGKVTVIVKTEAKPYTSTVFDAVAYIGLDDFSPECYMKRNMDALQECNPMGTYVNFNSETLHVSSYGTYVDTDGNPKNHTLAQCFNPTNRWQPNASDIFNFRTAEQSNPFVAVELADNARICGVSIRTELQLPTVRVVRIASAWSLGPHGLVNEGDESDICTKDLVAADGRFATYACRAVLSGRYLILQDICEACIMILKEVYAHSQPGFPLRTW